MPVVGSRGELVGIVTVDDMLKRLAMETSTLTEIVSREPLRLQIVVMKENLSTLDDPEKFITESELVVASNGLRQAVYAVRDWLGEQLDAVERDDNERVG